MRAQVAHLVLNETAASSLLRRFIECRSNLLKDILDGSGAAWPGQNDKRDMLGDADAASGALNFKTFQMYSGKLSCYIGPV